MLVAVICIMIILRTTHSISISIIVVSSLGLISPDLPRGYAFVF